MRFIAPFFITFFLFLLPLPLFAQPLLEASHLATQLTEESIQPIDIRSQEEYAKGHIPKAISAPYGLWRGPEDNPGQLAEPEAFEALVQSLGLKPEQHLVVYSSGDDETDFGAAARVYWTLKYLGFPHISVLNGGVAHWQHNAKHPISTQAQTLPKSHTKVELQPELAVDTDTLIRKLQSGAAQYQLLDARPPAFFQGETKAPTASVPGTIAGAQNIPFSQWFIPGQTRLRSAVEIRQQVAQQGLDSSAETLSFCNTGHWAAINWFVSSAISGVE